MTCSGLFYFPPHSKIWEIPTSTIGSEYKYWHQKSYPGQTVRALKWKTNIRQNPPRTLGYYLIFSLTTGRGGLQNPGRLNGSVSGGGLFPAVIFVSSGPRNPNNKFS